MKTISFSILFSTLQLFFNTLFFAFLQQFTAGENLRVAGDSAGRRRILTTLLLLAFIVLLQNKHTSLAENGENLISAQPRRSAHLE